MEGRCSICDHDHVFFEKLEGTQEDVHLECGWIKIAHFRMIKYCVECFYEYGGSDFNIVEG